MSPGVGGEGEGVFYEVCFQLLVKFEGESVTNDFEELLARNKVFGSRAV